MRIKALGAVGTVTGSCFQIEMNNGNVALLDCGLFQGGRQTELRNSETANYNPKKVKAIIITHAHMDHSGLAPRLVKEGYKGPVYATPPTCDLLKILWQDAANIQAHEAMWKSRKNSRQGKTGIEPLYTEDDAARAATMLEPLDFDQPREILPGLVAHYVAAGHILGAASVHLTVTEGARKKRVVFSGDLGRPGQLLMPDSVTPPPAEVIFMETTYGNRLHKDLAASRQELFQVINQACQERGKILIPAFAVERTQEILLLIAKGFHDRIIPGDLKIFLDSPLATAATGIYGQYKNLFGSTVHDWAAQGLSLEAVPNLKIVRDAQESQKLNDLKGPAIIIAGSGMANAGRILHHLKHNLWQPSTHVIFVGFQAQGSTGRLLVDGAESVKIFREVITVGAQIHTIGGFSAHADQKELVEWLAPQVRPGLQVNLIHGEPLSTFSFQQLAQEKFPEASFHIPAWLHYAELGDGLAPGEAPAVEPVIDAAEEQSRIISQSLIHKIDRLRELSSLTSKMDPAHLAELEEYLAKAENLMLEIQ